MSDDHKFPSQLAERFQVRMPDGLRDRIAEAAKANGRSMNTEIVTRLIESLDPPTPLELDEVVEAVREVLAKARWRADHRK